jgi:hypothetical protein
MKYFLTFVLSILLLASCQNQPVYNDGEVYSLKFADGRYKVVKVLGTNKKNIYLCIYDEVFNAPPKDLNAEAHRICQIDTSKHLDANGEYKEGSVKGSLFYPDDKVSFQESKPKLLFRFPVTEEEKRRIIQYENRYPENKDN